ncbi:MAG: D-alanyl-D-alanine carboxypeptidase family protein [Eubacteriales bacterium]
MKSFKYKQLQKGLVACFLSFSLLCSSSIQSMATEESEEVDIIDEVTEESEGVDIVDEEIDSSDISWPSGPEVNASAAILMDINTGTILYGKNIHDQLYPASITKILTAYIAMQESDMDEMVTFSSEAVYSINWREDANMGIKVGEIITMEQALYGVLVGSANEAAYAVGEHISGSMDDFVTLMNETATELGCLNSNFMNPNGIHDDYHYTTAYDMAMIGKAFFSNELLCNMSSTTSYQVPYSETQSNEELIVWAKSSLLPGKTYAYDYLVGTKTGYTSESNQTLVSCAENNGMKLVCVILDDESPNQFTDTINLFEWGFNHFQTLNISDLDTQYNITSTSFFSSNSEDLFGNSEPILEISDSDYIILPNDASFENTLSSISYDTENEDAVASINFTYADTSVGSIPITLVQQVTEVFDFDDYVEPIEVVEEDPIIYVNVINIVGIIAICFVILLVFFIFYAQLQHKRRRSRRRSKSRRNRYNSSYFNNYNDTPYL